MKKERFDLYWATHADEKQQLLQEIDDCEARIKSLKLEIVGLDEEAKRVYRSFGSLRFPEEDELHELRERRSQLSAQRNALGAFKHSEKKRLAAELEACSNKITNVDAELKRKKDAAKAEHQPELDEIATSKSAKENMITELKKQIEIDQDKLTRER